MPQLPPNTPPAIVQPASQQQQQQQSQTLTPGFNSTNENNAGSESNSESNNTVVQQGSLENVQINNTSSGLYEFAPGVAAPTPTLNVTAYSHAGSNGIAATFIIPLGGNVARQHRTLIDNRVKRIELDNESITFTNQLNLASACAKIIASGVVIDYADFPALMPCKSVTIRPPVQQATIPPVQKLVPPVRVDAPPTKPKEPKNPKVIRASW